MYRPLVRIKPGRLVPVQRLQKVFTQLRVEVQEDRGGGEDDIDGVGVTVAGDFCKTVND
jgi:hypothetical protein